MKELTPGPGPVVLLAAVLLSTLGTAPASAQSWELEVHAGGMLASRPTDGESRLPGPGPAFTTLSGTQSRRESSWYFGDGASLLNQVNAALGASGRIVSLDAVLRRAALERPGGGSVGFRLGRRLGPRLTAELSVERALASVQMNGSSRDGIEGARATFVTAWNGLIATGPFASPSVTSTADIRDGGWRQTLATAAVSVNLKSQGRFVPYLTVGAGSLWNGGEAPDVRLTGSYRFRPFGFFPVSETDTVTLRYTVEERSFVGLLGGGFKYSLSPRWGLRADVRQHLGSNKSSTLLDSHPQVATLDPAGAIAASTSPSMQFANNPATGVQSSLSGSPLSGFVTFEGKGRQSHLSIVGGLFLRF